MPEQVTITTDTLRLLGACKEWRDRFSRAFGPNGLTIYPDTTWKMLVESEFFPHIGFVYTAACAKGWEGWPASNLQVLRPQLAGIDLSGRDLWGCNLGGAILDDANLRRAILSDANLRNTSLRAANLVGVKMYYADCEEADMTGADLSCVNAERAYFGGAKLCNADLSDANLRYADLTGADLTRANLSRANLRYADIDGAVFDNADMTECIMPNGDLWEHYYD